MPLSCRIADKTAFVLVFSVSNLEIITSTHFVFIFCHSSNSYNQKSLNKNRPYYLNVTRCFFTYTHTHTYMYLCTYCVAFFWLAKLKIMHVQQKYKQKNNCAKIGDFGVLLKRAIKINRWTRRVKLKLTTPLGSARN